MGYWQRQIQDFPEGGVCGLSRVWIFYTRTFRSGTNHMVHGQNPSGKMPVDKTLVKIAGSQNASHFMGQEGENADLMKTLIISY